MDDNSQLSVIELKYFRDEVIRFSEELTKVTQYCPINDEIKEYALKFQISLEVFSELSELCRDLGAKNLHYYFDMFCETLRLAIEADHDRANKKIFLMVLDYREILQGIAHSMKDKERLKNYLKALEVQSFKQDRLRRGEFYSIVYKVDDFYKKQRAV